VIIIHLALVLCTSV